MKIIAGEEKVIVRGPRPEEQYWGAYQFPRPYDTGNGIAVSVDVAGDDAKRKGDSKLWLKSEDSGDTWHRISESEAEDGCGLLLANGDRIKFPPESMVCLDNYKIPDWSYLTPGYDFGKKAEEGTLPLQDGLTVWLDGTLIRSYKAERLPDSLSAKTWKMLRTPAGSSESVSETVPVEWDCLTRVVYSGRNYKPAMKPIYPWGNPKTGPDGAVWITTYSGEGHINPANGQYSPYYSAELFRSDDNCHSFKMRAHMEYEANGSYYPYQCGGFSDNDIEFMPDGSIVWFLRSTWAMSTGKEWSPMYFSRSTDNGFTWSKPVKFSEGGVLPRLCRLKCGVTLLCYARPGMYVCASTDDSGLHWTEPLELMTPGDRSGLANIKIDNPRYHQWDGSCNNPEMIEISENSALIFYTDFYYPDESGIKRKTVLCRKITVNP